MMHGTNLFPYNEKESMKRKQQ